MKFILKIVIASTIFSPFLLVGAHVSADSFDSRLADAAMARTNASVVYDGSYISIPYPNGDVPKNIGVCTDVVIRTYRQLDIDLQQLVHEDMQGNFDKYPSTRIWGLTRPDTNIDHRRVPNLQVFFTRHGISLPVSEKAADYKPGDLVTWVLNGNLPHIGIVSNHRSANGTPMIIHNIGAGPKHENMLFKYKITGHYRYRGEAS